MLAVGVMQDKTLDPFLFIFNYLVRIFFGQMLVLHIHFLMFPIFTEYKESLFEASFSASSSVMGC